MHLLVVAPQLGLNADGRIDPGGLLTFGRCVVRAVASFEEVTSLSIWAQADLPAAEARVEPLLAPYAHPGLRADARFFGGRRGMLSVDLAASALRRRFDHVMYLLVNQAVLSALPGHPPYSAWEIGREVFEPMSFAKRRALVSADCLLSISTHTTRLAQLWNPDLPDAFVVHLCFEPQPGNDPVFEYEPRRRERAVLIVGNMHAGMLYKGHQQLIAGWRHVVQAVPDAQLWIAGSGDGRSLLEYQVSGLPPAVASRILFLGHLDDDAMAERYRRCRVFAMPSTGEGFGIVYAEAARYGVPSVAGKFDAACEVVLHGQTGLLVDQDPYDIAAACVRLLTNDALARRLGEAAYRRCATEFSFDAFRRRLLGAWVPGRAEARLA
jgi:glycosyltransferase involved in cell wall biosynthesis